MDISKLFSIFLAAFLINNIILTRFLGVCGFFGVSDSLKPSIGMSLAFTFMLTTASALTWGIQHYILTPYHLEYLRLLSFILSITALAQLGEVFFRKRTDNLYKVLGRYLPMLVANCAILGVALLNINYSYGFTESIVHSLGVCAGYSLAIVVFGSINERLKFAPIPDFIKGYPVIFFTAALMSLAFMGFKGLLGIH